MLVLGAVLGLLLAASGLLRGTAVPSDKLPDGVVARVNDAPLLTADFERLVAGLESDTRSVADSDTRERVLDRMIDEELLVQRGLELGLAVRDRRVRGDLSSAVIRSVVIEAEQREPSPADLSRFFAKNVAFFTQPGRIHVQQIFFRVRTPDEDAVAASRAAKAFARLDAGEDFANVRTDGDPVISKIPDALLPETKLRDYIGPAALRAALELEVGAPSQPVRSGVGYHILLLVERESANVPSFAEIEPQVRAEWRRRAGDEALRNYLDELRNRADLVVRAVAATER
jgi:parvulin-like peptidyl-prolyl isomerase